MKSYELVDSKCNVDSTVFPLSEVKTAIGNVNVANKSCFIYVGQITPTFDTSKVLSAYKMNSTCDKFPMMDKGENFVLFVNNATGMVKYAEATVSENNMNYTVIANFSNGFVAHTFASTDFGISGCSWASQLSMSVASLVLLITYSLF